LGGSRGQRQEGKIRSKKFEPEQKPKDPRGGKNVGKKGRGLNSVTTVYTGDCNEKNPDNLKGR